MNRNLFVDTYVKITQKNAYMLNANVKKITYVIWVVNINVQLKIMK